MSGRKCSEFRLQREREEKPRMLQSLGNLHAEVTGLKARIKTLREGISEGLRTTFAADMQQAQRWLAQVAPPDIQALGMDTEVARLQTTQAALEQVASQGRQMQERLTVTLTQRADDMGRRLAQRLAEVEQRYIGRQQLLALWCGEEHTGKCLVFFGVTDQAPVLPPRLALQPRCRCRRGSTACAISSTARGRPIKWATRVAVLAGSASVSW